MAKLSDTFLNELESYIKSCVQDEVARQLKGGESSGMPEEGQDDQISKTLMHDDEMPMGGGPKTDFMSDNGIQRASNILQRVLKKRSV